MFARRALRRPGMGLVGATDAGAYAAGSSAARRSAQEAFLNQQLAQPEAQQQAQAMPQPTAASSGLTDEKIEELRKLGEIKKEGLLTYEEFTAQKQRLLS